MHACMYVCHYMFLFYCLCCRYLSSNKLTGTLVSLFGQIRNLQALILHKNSLTFVEPGALSSQLSILTLHDNQLRHAAPSFADFNSLNTLTLFRNELWGSLILPNNAPQLSSVLVHSNRHATHFLLSLLHTATLSDSRASPGGYRAMFTTTTPQLMTSSTMATSPL